MSAGTLDEKGQHEAQMIHPRNQKPKNKCSGSHDRRAMEIVAILRRARATDHSRPRPNRIRERFAPSLNGFTSREWKNRARYQPVFPRPRFPYEKWRTSGVTRAQLRQFFLDF